MFSECVPAVSSCVPVVTDVSVSLPSVCVLGEVFPSGSDCEILKPQSFFLSPESAEPFMWKVKEMCECGRVRPKTRSSCQGGGHKKWTVKSTKVGQRSAESVARRTLL